MKFCFMTDSGVESIITAPRATAELRFSIAMERLLFQSRKSSAPIISPIFSETAKGIKAKGREKSTISAKEKN
jgi:hypothetical protein